MKRNAIILVLICSFIINVLFIAVYLKIPQKLGDILSVSIPSKSTTALLDNPNFVPSRIGTGSLDIKNKTSIALFCKQSAYKNGNYYQTLSQFAKNDIGNFKNIFVGDDKELIKIGTKKIFYAFPDCTLFSEGTSHYGECMIKQYEKTLFFRDDKVSIKNIDQISDVDFETMQKSIKEGKCEDLKSNDFFPEAFKYCTNKNDFLVYLNKVSLDLINSVCQK